MIPAATILGIGAVTPIGRDLNENGVGALTHLGVGGHDAHAAIGGGFGFDDGSEIGFAGAGESRAVKK